MSVLYPISTAARAAAFFDEEQFSILGEMGEGGDAEIIIEVVGQFLEDVEGVFSRLSRGIEALDFQQAADAAHTLKGSFATFGLMRAHGWARQIEQLAEDGQADGLAEGYRAMIGCFHAGKNALQAHLDEQQFALA